MPGVALRRGIQTGVKLADRKPLEGFKMKPEWTAGRAMSRTGKLLLAASALPVMMTLMLGAGPVSAASNSEILRRLEKLEAEQKILKEELRKEKVKNQKLEEAVKKVGSGSKTVSKGKSGGSLELSGQVNRALMFHDDGRQGQVNFVDNDHSSTRFRLKARYPFNDDITAGSTLEVQIESNSSGNTAAAGFSQFTRDDDPNGFTLRIAEVWAQSKVFGKLSLGQGKTASDDTSKMDLSGTDLIMTSQVKDRSGALCFRRQNGEQFGVTDTLANTCGARFSIARMFDNFDGLGREDRIRYDTPKVYGFQISTSAISQGGWDVAGRFTGELFETVKIAAAIAFARAGQTSSIDGSQVNGSISALHTSTGLNVTFAGGNRNQHREVPRVPGAGVTTDDAQFWYVKAGWTGKVLDIGKTSVSVDYFQSRNQDGSNGSIGRAIGFGAVQKIDKIATELYLGVTRHEIETDALVAGAGTPVAEFEPIWSVLAGARVKF